MKPKSAFSILHFLYVLLYLPGKAGQRPPALRLLCFSALLEELPQNQNCTDTEVKEEREMTR